MMAKCREDGESTSKWNRERKRMNGGTAATGERERVDMFANC